VSSEPVAVEGGECPLCASGVAAAETRCPECGWSLAGVAGRPGPYSRAALWWTVAGFLAVYLITLGIVAFTH
jgi:hypothetical protein